MFGKFDLEVLPLASEWPCDLCSRGLHFYDLYTGCDLSTLDCGHIVCEPCIALHSTNCTSWSTSARRMSKWAQEWCDLKKTTNRTSSSSSSSNSSSSSSSTSIGSSTSLIDTANKTTTTTTLAPRRGDSSAFALGVVNTVYCPPDQRIVSFCVPTEIASRFASTVPALWLRHLLSGDTSNPTKKP